MATILVTGSAGFIGFHLSELLLSHGHQVLGYDAMTDYYEVGLKQERHRLLSRHNGFYAYEARLEDLAQLQAVCKRHEPQVIVHLAGQAGVRYSIEDPHSYIQSNVVGSMNVLEQARELQVEHLLMASTSSVYGANSDMPFTEAQKCDTPICLYAATKKANEAMGHSQSHLFGFPVTMFRFFTVYGPWGRPDMALFKFTKAILDGQPIDVYNHGDMFRDFTYVLDLVEGIRLLIDVPPKAPNARDGEPHHPNDTLSPVAPYRVVNIGNNDKVRLMDFIDALETSLGRKAKKNFMDMQPGDVFATWADTSLLQFLTGYKPKTHVAEGVDAFVQWYRHYYKII